MIKFRPHHFLCTLGFQGIGYSPRYVKNYQNIVTQLTKDPLTKIEVVEGLDEICGACPHKREQNQCESQNLVAGLDKAHQTILGIKNNQVISWKQAKALIRSRMTIEKFQIACEGCEWKSLGVCESSLTKLLKEPELEYK